MEARLEIRRSNNEPKCASCAWWDGGDKARGKCAMNETVTLDLAVCSAWRNNIVVQQVIEAQ